MSKFLNRRAPACSTEFSFATYVLRTLLCRVLVCSIYMLRTPKLVCVISFLCVAYVPRTQNIVCVGVLVCNICAENTGVSCVCILHT